MIHRLCQTRFTVHRALFASAEEAASVWGLGCRVQEERIFIELVTSDRKLKASREVQGSGFGVWGLGTTARTARSNVASKEGAQGYLSHKKLPHLRTLHQACA